MVRSCGRNNVPTGSARKMASRMPGTPPLAMMTDSPATVAKRAARSLLRMPPEPNALRLPPAFSKIEASIAGTVVSSDAEGSVRGSQDNRPSTTVSRMSSGACSRFVTRAAK